MYRREVDIDIDNSGLSSRSNSSATNNTNTMSIDPDGGYVRALSHPPLYASNEQEKLLLRRSSNDSSGRKKLKYANNNNNNNNNNNSKNNSKELNVSIANSMGSSKMGNVHPPRGGGGGGGGGGGTAGIISADQSLVGGGAATIITEAKTEKTSSISSSSTGSRRRQQELEHYGPAENAVVDIRITPIMEVGGDNFVQEFKLNGESLPGSRGDNAGSSNGGGGARGDGTIATAHSGEDHSKGSNNSRGESNPSNPSREIRGSGGVRGGVGIGGGGGASTLSSKKTYSAMDWPSAPSDAFMDSAQQQQHLQQQQQQQQQQQHYPLSHSSPGASERGERPPVVAGVGGPNRGAVLHACDDKGRCLFHPHVILRKKVILGVMGGWKDVLPSCPECESEDIMGAAATGAVATGQQGGSVVSIGGKINSNNGTSATTSTSMAVIAPEGRNQKYSSDQPRNPKRQVKFDRAGEGVDTSGSSREHVTQGPGVPAIRRPGPSYESRKEGEEEEEEEEGKSSSDDDDSSSGDSSGSSSSASSSSVKDERVVRKSSSTGDRPPPRSGLRPRRVGTLTNSFKRKKREAAKREKAAAAEREKGRGSNSVAGGGPRKPKKQWPAKANDDFISAYIGTGVPSRHKFGKSRASGRTRAPKEAAARRHHPADQPSKFPPTLSPDPSMESSVAGSTVAASSQHMQGKKKMLKGVSKLIKKSKKKISKSVNKAADTFIAQSSTVRVGRAQSFEEDYDNYDYSEGSDYEEYDMYGSSHDKQEFFDRHDPPTEGGGLSTNAPSRESNPSRRRDRSKEKYPSEGGGLSINSLSRESNPSRRRDRSKEKFPSEGGGLSINSLPRESNPSRRRDRSKEKYHGEPPPLRQRSKERFNGEPPPIRQRSKERYKGKPPPIRQRSKERYSGEQPPLRQRSKEKYHGERRLRQRSKEKYLSQPPPRNRSKEKYLSQPPPRRHSKEKYLGQPMPNPRGQGRSFHGELERDEQIKIDSSGNFFHFDGFRVQSRGADGRQASERTLSEGDARPSKGSIRGAASRRRMDSIASSNASSPSHDYKNMDVDDDYHSGGSVPTITTPYNSDVAYQWDRVPIPESTPEDAKSTEESASEEDSHQLGLKDVAYQWDRMPLPIESTDSLTNQLEEEDRAELEFLREQRKKRLSNEFDHESILYYDRRKSQEEEKAVAAATASAHSHNHEQLGSLHTPPKAKPYERRSLEDEHEAVARSQIKASQRSWHTAPEAESPRSLSPSSELGTIHLNSTTVLDMEAVSNNYDNSHTSNNKEGSNNSRDTNNDNSKKGLLSMDDLLQSIQEDIAMTRTPTLEAKQLDRSTSAPGIVDGGGNFQSRDENSAKDHASMPQLDRSATGSSSHENSSSQEFLLDTSVIEEEATKTELLSTLAATDNSSATIRSYIESSSSDDESSDEEEEQLAKLTPQPPPLPGFGNYGGLKIDLSALQASKPTTKPKSKTVEDTSSGGMQIDLSSLQASKPIKKTDAKEDEASKEKTNPSQPQPPPIEVDRHVKTFDVNNLPYTSQFGASGMYTGSVSEQYEPHGKGTMVYDDGEILKGYWNVGDLVRESELYSDDEDEDEEDEEEIDDLSSSMANIGSKVKGKYSGGSSHKDISRSRSRSKEPPPKPIPPPPPPPPKPKTPSPSPPPPEYKVGDPGKHRDMIIDKEEAINAIHWLKFGDGAFIRRSDGKWTYAVVKSLEETEQGKSAIRFLVNDRKSSKSYAKKYWGTHVRPLKGTKVKPAPEPDQPVRGASSESREGRAKKRESAEPSSRQTSTKMTTASNMDRGISCPPTQSKLTFGWGFGPPVRNARSRSRSRRRTVSFSPMRTLTAIAESDIEDEEDVEGEEEEATGYNTAEAEEVLEDI